MKSNLAARNKRVSNPRHRKQQHLLEVTVRRNIARQQQARKMIRAACKLMLFVGLLAGAYVGGKELLRRFFWENPDYYLTDVRVPPDGALTREQILTAAGIVEGRNIFTIDLAKAREAIDKLPQVEVAEIQRVLPNRIDVNIVERKPIAWTAAKADEDPSTSEKSFLIDARGVVMRSKTMLPEYLLLPIISGVEVENFAPGQTVRSFEMQAALDLLRLNADSTRFQIRNIDISKGYCLVVTDRTHAQVTFGLDRVDQQLARLNRLLDRIHPTQREIQTINLLVERNVPVMQAAPSRTENAKDKFLATKPGSAVKATPAPTIEKSLAGTKRDDSSAAKPAGTPGNGSRKRAATPVKKPFKP